MTVTTGALTATDILQQARIAITPSHLWTKGVWQQYVTAQEVKACSMGALLLAHGDRFTEELSGWGQITYRAITEDAEFRVAVEHLADAIYASGLGKLPDDELSDWLEPPQDLSDPFGYYHDQDFNSYIIEFNDAIDRSHAEVLEVFDAAIERSVK